MQAAPVSVWGLHTGIYRSTHMEEISSSGGRELCWKNFLLLCTGVYKSGNPLVGRKDVSTEEPSFERHLIPRTGKMEAICLRMMLGSDVPPSPSVTSQTQNTFWIRPLHLQVNVNTDLIHSSTIYVEKLVEAFQCQVLLGKIIFHIQRRLLLSFRGNPIIPTWQHP